MPALLLGSISTIADTSEMQRQAFNEAFTAHGLDWHWDRDDYLAMLEKSGGRDRVADYARSTGQDVDADAVHATKSEIFRKNVAMSPPPARPGVLDAVKGARGDGLKVALVTTTSRDNVTALIDALGPDLGRDDFDLIVDSSTVATPKPDAASYTYALETLGEPAGACVAVEDNVGGVEAAVAAGVACVAFPNANTAGHDFGQASARTERLDLGELEGFTSRG